MEVRDVNPVKLDKVEGITLADLRHTALGDPDSFVTVYIDWQDVDNGLRFIYPVRQVYYITKSTPSTFLNEGDKDDEKVMQGLYLKIDARDEYSC